MQVFYFYWLLVVVSLVLYAIIILSFAGGWANLKEFHPQSSIFSTKVSVIIAMHNEGKHIVQCLQSLMHQNIQTQGLEVIVVDDYSTDQSRALAEKMSQTDRRIRVIKNEQERGKKPDRFIVISKKIVSYSKHKDEIVQIIGSTMVRD